MNGRFFNVATISHYEKRVQLIFDPFGISNEGLS